jgi:hypothetical protein
MNYKNNTPHYSQFGFNCELQLTEVDRNLPGAIVPAHESTQFYVPIFVTAVQRRHQEQVQIGEDCLTRPPRSLFIEIAVLQLHCEWRESRFRTYGNHLTSRMLAVF